MKVKFLGFINTRYAEGSRGHFVVGEEYKVTRFDDEDYYLFDQNGKNEYYARKENFEVVGKKPLPIPMSVNYINPDTVVVWDDGDVTRVTCKEGERWDEYIGFLACLAKKVYGGHNQYKKFIKNAVTQ